MLPTFILLIGNLIIANAASESSLECGACSLLVTQLELKIAAIDPNKKIESGSYRVSPDGQQKGLNKIPYARSESHLVEILENVCDEAKNYKLVVNTITGKAVYVHKDATYLSGNESKTLRAKLENACNDFVDSNEEDLLTFLKTAHESPVKAFCTIEKGVCSSVDVSPLPPSNPPRDEEPMTLADIPEDEL